MKYLVEIEKTEQGFSARVPDFPGLASYGEDQWVVMQAIQQALRDHLSALAQAGQPIPEPATRPLELELDHLVAPDQPASDPFRRFLDHVLQINYPESIPFWAEPVRDCLGLCEDVDTLVADCEALLGHADSSDDDDDDDDNALYSGLGGGKIGDLKDSAIAYLNHFIGVQPYFEAILPIESIFSSDLPNLAEMAYALDSLNQLASLVVEKTRFIREGQYDGEYDPAMVGFYFFWLSRAASMILTLTSGFDTLMIVEAEDDCGCGCGCEDEDCDCEGDCDCEDCDCDDCDCDCDCDHDHDHDAEDHPKA